MPTYKTAALLIFLSLFSCTVTKRLHRPGYHIEWKKNYRTQKDIEVTESTKNDESKTTSIDIKSNKTEPELIEGNALHSDSTAVQKARIEVENLNGQANFQPFRSVQKTGRFYIEKPRTYLPFKKLESTRTNSRTANGFVIDGFRNLGYVLLGISVFLLLGSLVSYFGFWILEELFYSLVFSGNGFIVGLLGLLLFLIILVFVFLAYALVRYILGGSYLGFIVSMVCAGLGLLSLLIAASL